MRPLKSLAPIASWLLRVAIMVLIFQKYSDSFLTFSLQSTTFYFSAAFIVSAFFLLLGGLLSKTGYSVFSGFAILVLSLAIIFINGLSIDEVMRQTTLIAMGAYFVANGNS